MFADTDSRYGVLQGGSTRLVGSGQTDDDVAAVVSTVGNVIVALLGAMICLVLPPAVDRRRDQSALVAPTKP